MKLKMVCQSIHFVTNRFTFIGIFRVYFAIQNVTAKSGPNEISFHTTKEASIKPHYSKPYLVWCFTLQTAALFG